MTPAAFDYVRAETREHALEILACHGDDAALLAGGQSLVPMLSLRLARPTIVIDIGGLSGLSGLERRPEGLFVGALTRHRDLARAEAAFAQIEADAPLLSEAARWVAHPSIRNRGTLGGAIALGDGAAEYPAAAIALGARVALAWRRGERRVQADAFFVGPMMTEAAAHEMVLGLEIPPLGPLDAFGFCEIAERRGDYALAGAAIVARRDAAPRVALFGAADAAKLAGGASKALAGDAPADWDEALCAAAGEAARADLGDSALDPARRHLAGVAVARAAADLAKRARAQARGTR